MSYPYSVTNRLDQPHTYMYTPFEGASLLHGYKSSRLEFLGFLDTLAYNETADPTLESFSIAKLRVVFSKLSLPKLHFFRKFNKNDTSAQERELLKELGLTLPSFDHMQTVDTYELLRALLAAQLIFGATPLVKEWLDRMVQRFEVSKKLYTNYLAGFRKGEGANNKLELYYMFSLSLCFYYADTARIKYLNTLLKALDLLCSVSNNIQNSRIPLTIISAVVASEVVFVEELAAKKGFSYATE